MGNTTRRNFLRDAAFVVAAGRAASWRASSWHTALSRASALRIGFIDDGSSRAHATSMGVTLGVDEARHAAAMFGGDVQLVTVSARTGKLPALSAIIGDAAMSRVGEAARADLLYVNVANADDAWRGARCGAALFHVMPSAAMARDAAAGAQAPATARVEAWDPSLTKFGADTLNQRFTSRVARPMTADAWTGWFAVKLLWESSLRARSTEPAKLREYLARDTTQFDGHKGRPLSFRSWDRQLRQPVYVVANSRVIEWPPAPAGDESARQSLDAIGTTPAASECHAI